MTQQTEWTKAILIGPVSPGVIAIQLFSTGEIMLVSRHLDRRQVDPENGIIEIELPAEIPDEEA